MTTGPLDCDRGHDEWKHADVTESCAYCGRPELEPGELLAEDDGTLVCDDCDQDRGVVDVPARPEYL